MAKNRNQNPNRRSEHQDQDQDQGRESAPESQEQVRSHRMEEPIAPSTTQVPRKQQKRFGHN